MAKLLFGLIAAVGILFILGCNGDGDTLIFSQGSASGILPESAAKVAIQKAAPGGTNTINLSGGNGINGDGGDGGYWECDLYCPAGLVVAQGVKTANAEFTVPTDEPTPVFGSEKLTVAADLTLDVYIDTATANASTSVGDYYLVLSSGNIYRNATPLAPVVTGLEVAQGATLTLGLNINYGGSGAGQESCYIWCDEDIVINGTVTVKDLTTGTVGGAPVDTTYSSATATTADKGALFIECDYNFFIGSNGRIDTSGDDAAAANTRGGDGGHIYIYGRSGVYIHGGVYADGGDGTGTGIGGAAATYVGSLNDIGIETNNSSQDGGIIVITGSNTISACGGDGATGGNAGGIEIYANTYLYNTSPIIANGGNGSNGNGGDASDIYLYSYYCSLYNSGDITGNGGNAINGNGGDGAAFYMYASESDDGMSNLYNSGDITLNGGNAINGLGGDGYSTCEIYNEGSGNLVNTGDWSIVGGSATGATSTGGDGGDLNIYQYAGDDYWYGEDANNHDIIWTGNIDLRGGSANTGGDGGYIYLDNTDYDEDGDYWNGGTYFVGYDAVYADGGNGANGGGGGYLYFYTEDAEQWDITLENGLVIYYADFYARGGTGSNGTGGDGGYVDIDVEGEAYFESQVCKIRGDIYLQGGNGTTGGGDGIGDSDDFVIYAFHLVEIIGNVYGHGGNATTGNNDGGEGCYYGIDISATYDVVIQGNWHMYGGNATGTGTGGSTTDDQIDIYAGLQVTMNGEIQMQGGDSVTGTGGDAGDVYIFSQTWPTDWRSFTWDISAGSGTPAGSKGEMWIDWVNWDR